MKRPILINHNREKLLNALVYFSKNTNLCGKTKLFKLLYFLDFIHFRETGRSVTGLDYYAWDKGPVPQDLFHELKQPDKDLKDTIALLKQSDDEDDKLCKVIAKRPFDPKYFSKREKKIMEYLSFIFKEALAKNMVEITHLTGTPWDKTMKERGPGKKIDYSLAIDGSKGALTSEEIKERISEVKEVTQIFEGR
ncbi:MAG: SocA family protein [Deltaproteobacteria bacterium]|nr:SocA family protein [Deltaproteobacteria bacterium]